MTIERLQLRRAAWLEIDLEALRSNVEVIRGLAGDRVAVAPVVKADAYGHGLAAVGPALAGVSDALCVATLDEALTLRASDVGGRIMILYPVPADGVGDAVQAGLELTIMSSEDLRSVRARSMPGAAPALVHLAVETGMSRGGLALDAVAAIAAEIQADPDAELRGIWSHLASAADAGRSAAQVERFERAVASLRRRHEPVPPRHLAATDGIFAGTAPMLEMVRPGLAVYGVLEASLPLAGHARDAALALAPAMTLKANAAAFSDVPIGAVVGYGGHWQATRPSRVAILPLGYGDGYARAMEPGAEVLLRGRRVPLVGAISMDALAIDVTDLADVGYEEEFVLLGTQGEQSISTGELARWRNTITWETLSSMAPRLGRVYNRSAGGAPSG
ncbi:MAG: alanine racemase [Chloroflexota bacterium]